MYGLVQEFLGNVIIAKNKRNLFGNIGYFQIK